MTYFFKTISANRPVFLHIRNNLHYGYIYKIYTVKLSDYSRMLRVKYRHVRKNQLKLKWKEKPQMKLKWKENPQMKLKWKEIKQCN